MVIAGALALLALFGVFYMAGIAVGAVVVPLAVVAVVVLVFWAMMKRRPS